MKRQKTARRKLHDLINRVVDGYYNTRKLYTKIDELVDEIKEEENGKD